MKLIHCLLLAISCVVSLLAAVAQDADVITTFTSPQPVDVRAFPSSIAAVGTDRVLIGAAYDASYTDVGRAYLFSTNGTLLVTIINRDRTTRGYFGFAVAALGSDRLIISAPGSGISSGKVYLLDTNGGLLTAFTNPIGNSAGDSFGHSVATLGNDRVLIGAPYGGRAGSDAARAFLFRTNGALLATFTHPVSKIDSGFGSVVAALGSEGVLIGAPFDDTAGRQAGVAHLFSTNGTLLTTFTNPTPAAGDIFGWFVATVSSDRVLISSPGDDTAGTNAGAAYLFSTDGTLVNTFMNPGHASEVLGRSLTAVGSDRVLIGTSGSEKAYLFGTNGALLTTIGRNSTLGRTISNQDPASVAPWGAPVVSLGNDLVLVSTTPPVWDYRDGEAYLFSISPRPSLNIWLTATNTVVISWPSAVTNFFLQENVASVSVNWSNVTAEIRNNGTNKTVIVSPAERSRFYRLFRGF